MKKKVFRERYYTKVDERIEESYEEEKKYLRLRSFNGRYKRIKENLNGDI